MKKSPDHLPKRKRDELARVASVIRRFCDDVEMIVLFGSYARGEFGMQRDDFCLAAFHLHQSAEACYKAILLVFTNYLPHEHFLRILGDMAEDHDPAFATVFPRETYEEEEEFKLLDYAYIGARYQPSYRISEEELEHLSPRVKILLELTEKICTSRIESIGKGK